MAVGYKRCYRCCGRGRVCEILISQYYYLLSSSCFSYTEVNFFIRCRTDVCSWFHQTVFSSLILPLFTSFAIIVPRVNLPYFYSYELFFPRDFSCDVLGARVQALWKGWSAEGSAQTVSGGDGEGK